MPDIPSPKIALTMMVKNETKRLRFTLDSIQNLATLLIIFDTGSTDDTIQILRDFSKSAKIPLHLKQGDFVDFSTSRNELLDYADSIANETPIDFLLLLDCNDEVKGIAPLKSFLKNQKIPEIQKNQTVQNFQTNYPTAYLVSQQWLAGEQIIKYFNVRILRPNYGWRYTGVVHEFYQNVNNLDSPDNKCQFTDNSTESSVNCSTHPFFNLSISNTPAFCYEHKTDEMIDVVSQYNVTTKIPEISYIFQDRNLDDDKTGKRFVRDRALLEAEHEKNPNSVRTLFYLAQTYKCLNMDAEAYKFYALRGQVERDFPEERFEALLQCGEIVMKYLPLSSQSGQSGNWFSSFTWETALGWYMQALTVFQRIEPLIAITRHYQSIGQLPLAYMFVHQACLMDFPTDSLLFVDKNLYEYERWHLLGILAYYVNQHDEGYNACMKAIQVRNNDVDKSNLKFYLDAMKSRKK